MSPVPQHKSRARAGRGGGERGDAAFPAAVQAEALEVVDQIVAPGNRGEKVVDLGGALLAGRIENIAHARSLTRWAAAKSKGIRYFSLAQIVLC